MNLIKLYPNIFSYNQSTEGDKLNDKYGRFEINKIETIMFHLYRTLI